MGTSPIKTGRPSTGDASTASRPAASHAVVKPPPSSASSVADDDEPAGAITRGRKTERDHPMSDDDGHGGVASGEDDGGKATGPRKRKRSRKGLDKKYMCPHEDCGKSYSRAEHLYRHQLNHTPKQIYKCDFPDCPRWFVRQDLCARHRERHTTRGSHLQRKDSHVPGGSSEPSSAVDAHPATQLPASSPAGMKSGHLPMGSGPALRSELSIKTGPYSGPGPGSAYDMHSASHLSSAGDMAMQMQRGPASASYVEPFHAPPPHLVGNGGDAYGATGHLHRSNSENHYYTDSNLMAAGSRASFGGTSGTGYEPSGHAFAPQLDPRRYHQSLKSNGQHAAMSPADGPTSPAQFKRPSTQLAFPPNQGINAEYSAYTPQHQMGGFASLPPPAYAAPTVPPGRGQYHNATGFGGPPPPRDELSGMLLDSPMADVPMGVFDPDDYARSPTVLADNFAAWLFNDYSAGPSGRPPDSALLDPSLRVASNGGAAPAPSQDPMAVASILGSSAPGSILSEAKRQALLDLIDTRFTETKHSAVGHQKEQLFAGNPDHADHVLSLSSLQTYIGSYWYHFHDQMPILHRPTFSVDNAQNLLLIAMIAIGAANLDKMYGPATTAAGAELATFLAWHLRGALFMDKDFPPPTKLWVLQALLLLEAYEKLYSSRILHERSQIHHATTISLLRRGSTLLGRSALDSPPTEPAESSGAGDDDATAIVATPDPWWNHWITTEATKRVAFACFIMDSTHATMFSHTAVMVAHEMRLRLPVDEALWTATSGVAVSRLRSTHDEPVAFLDGLKGTLNGRAIRTNAFGRAALMAGLLNVSFHLGQRDMQVRSLGVELGGKDRWRGTLTKAFDIWERDWGAAPPPSPSNRPPEPLAFSASRWQSERGTKEEAQRFESRVVLHHLAHMGMHVDIVQCQIFAGAARLLGRSITPADRAHADRRMRALWAPKASARDAVFYSLRFLVQVLAPYLHPPSPPSSAGAGAPSSSSSRASLAPPAYSPRDDYLLHRPWVLYFAALVVWSYGYALEGALPQPVDEALVFQHSRQVDDMRAFFARVGAVQRPDDLEKVAGRNQVVGLLGVLIASFRRCRWELMREAGRRLREGVNLLCGREDQEEG